MELTLKGALKILGVGYPKIHDVAPVFSDQLQQKQSISDPSVLLKIEGISLWLAESRAPSFYLDREYGVEDAEQALGDAALVVSEIRRPSGLAGKPS